MSMGQLSMMHYRYQLVDYLPYMYGYNFVIITAQPSPIASYDTLFYPFDSFIWNLVLGLTAAQIALFIIIETAWVNVSGRHTSDDYLYEGNAVLYNQ